MDKMDKENDDTLTNLRFITYWQLLGKVASVFCIPIIVFTLLLAIRLDNLITWNYWIVFSPLFVTLLSFLLATASQSLSAPAPPIVRIVWILFVISITIFVVFLVLHLQSQSFFSPSLPALFIPLYAGLGILLFAGFYLFISGCCCGTAYQQKKHVLSAIPIFCFSVVMIPLIILISFKEGVDHIPNTSWAVIFIPLFVLDAFCFCMGFFLLLFSCGGSKDAMFSLAQLFLFLVIIPSSVSFKILLGLYLDKTLHMPVIYIFIPLVVMEVLLFTCGLAVISNKKKQYIPVATTA